MIETFGGSNSRIPTGLPVLTPMDIATGWPSGYGRVPEPAPSPTDPVDALRDSIRSALESTPCVVGFSGGRDSSIVLALAAEAAHREQLEPPVAVTFRHDGDANAEESEHQELVIAHLGRMGLPVEWQQVQIGHEFDLIGPLVGPVVIANGSPVWPASLGPTIELCRRAAGGTVLTGEFGDEITGAQRMTVLRGVVRRRGRGLTGLDWTIAAAAATPRMFAGWWPQLDRTVDHEWLTHNARAEARRRVRADVRRLPLRWDRAVRRWMTRRAVMIGQTTTDAAARAYGCRLVHPLGEDAFIDGFAALGGPIGVRSRSVAVELLSAGLLPTEVVRRRSKATFVDSRFGPVTRSFVANWDGSGIDSSLVDVEILADSWRNGEFSALSALLLQQAWVASIERKAA